MNRSFGFRQTADSRDHRHVMASRKSSSRLPEVKRWKLGPVLDQGEEGACVGFSCKHLLTSEPFIQTDGPTAREIYLQARLIDEFDDNEVEEGTSVRAGLNVLKSKGLIRSYQWAPDVDAILGHLSNLGPVVAGTDWYGYSTDHDGRMRFEGRPVGGHAYLLTGFDRQAKVLFFVNSWGVGFGHAGAGYITFADFERQLQRGGCAAGVKEK